MSKRSFLCSVAVFCAAAAFPQGSQPRVAAVGQQFQTLPSPLPQGQTLDSTRCVVLYRHTYPVDNFTDGFRTAEDRLTLQIGSRVCKTFSHDLHLWDRNLTYGETNKIGFRFDRIDYEVFRNYPAGRFTVQRRIPYSRILQGSTQVVEYSEPLPQVDWAISDEADSVAGYRCLRAEGRFCGRLWIVWFAPELPFPVGPWKLGGLPGLILRAEDAAGDYRFECERIASEVQPVLLYDWHPVKMSKPRWQKTERRMFEHPADYFSRNGEIRVLDLTTRQPLDGEWTVRYNPIELE